MKRKMSSFDPDLRRKPNATPKHISTVTLPSITDLLSPPSERLTTRSYKPDFSVHPADRVGQWLLPHITHMTIKELTELSLKRDSFRTIYGEDAIAENRMCSQYCPIDHDAVIEEDFVSKKHPNHRPSESSRIHRRKERERRERHGHFLHVMHRQSSDLSCLLGSQFLPQLKGELGQEPSSDRKSNCAEAGKDLTYSAVVVDQKLKEMVILAHDQLASAQDYNVTPGVIEVPCIASDLTQHQQTWQCRRRVPFTRSKKSPSKKGDPIPPTPPQSPSVDGGDDYQKQEL